TTSCRRYAPPAAVRVVSALATLLAMVSMRSRWAVKPEPLVLIAVKNPMSHPPEAVANPNRGRSGQGRGLAPRSRQMVQRVDDRADVAGLEQRLVLEGRIVAAADFVGDHPVRRGEVVRLVRLLHVAELVGDHLCLRRRVDGRHGLVLVVADE